MVVVAILSILAVAVILIINPAELFKQARDSTRLSDMANINSSLNLFVVDSPDASLGTASTTYISIPDPTATSTAGTQCQGLGLSELPSGWTYHCAATSTYRNTDGTGWVPVNFQSMSFGSTLGTLPIDPINTTTSGNYYTYTPGGSWQLTATPESNKVRTTQADQTTGAITKGTDLTLSPLFNPSGLVGYWKFDEGSGASSTDSSGNNNPGSLISSPTWTTGKVGEALSFNGSTNYVNVGDPTSGILDFGTGDFTIAAWFKLDVLPGTFTAIVNKGAASIVGYSLSVTSANYLSGSIQATGGTNQNVSSISSALSVGVWTHGVAVFDRDDNIYIYKDGVNVVTSDYSAGNTNSISNSTAFNIGARSGSYKFPGLIDEVRVYSRTLSAAEIMALYNATR